MDMPELAADVAGIISGEGHNMPHHAMDGHHGGSPYPFLSELSSPSLRPAALFDVRGSIPDMDVSGCKLL